MCAPWKNRLSRATAVLCTAALLSSCERTPVQPTRRPRADLIGGFTSYLTQQLLANEPLVSDGSTWTDEPLPPGHTIHVRSEERRVGKSVDLGGRRIIKKKKKKNR